MNLLDFLYRYRKTLAFSIKEVKRCIPDSSGKACSTGRKRDRLFFRNGWYNVAGHIEREDHLYWVANKIYRPSYVSLEMALEITL